jgi:hypothetical protein
VIVYKPTDVPEYNKQVMTVHDGPNGNWYTIAMYEENGEWIDESGQALNMQFLKHWCYYEDLMPLNLRVGLTSQQG